MRLCSVSVDLDEIPNYFAIHGLPAPEGPEAHLVYDEGLSRLHDWAAQHGIPLTLFAIGSDMRRAHSARALRRMAQAGHEIANHTLDHRYDLTRLARAEQLYQVSEAARLLSEQTGAPVTGFRAPGYTITDELYDVLNEAGVAYSSSVFPCPPYYLAKALALLSIKLNRRHSHSILDRPEVLLAPREPYRVGRPYWEPGTGLLELPVQVTQALRLPYIGTTLTLFGSRVAERLTRGVVGVPFVNLELHGIDVLGREDGLQALDGHQLDVRVPAQSKLEALSRAVELLARERYSFVRLDEAASRMGV